ncbi:ATP-dependent DNA ligase, partial [Streptomyces nojiriensis]
MPWTAGTDLLLQGVRGPSGVRRCFMPTSAVVLPTEASRETPHCLENDGHRALLFSAAGPGGPVLVQTRRGALVQDRWPDLVAAAEAQLPHVLVLDGELVVWDTEAGRLSFEVLQRRAAPRARGALALAVKWQAYFVAFDLLQHDGQELLTRPYAERRALLGNLFLRACPDRSVDALPDDDGPGQGAGVAGVLDGRVRGGGDPGQAPERPLPARLPGMD